MEQHVDVISVTGEMETQLENQCLRSTPLYTGRDQRFVCCVHDGWRWVFALCLGESRFHTIKEHNRQPLKT